MNHLHILTAAGVTAVALALAAPAGATEIAQVEGSCDGTFHVTGVPGNLDVRINGTVYTADAFTFVDRDGTFDIEYFNQFGEWGSEHHDFTVTACSSATTPPGGSSTTLPGTPTLPPSVSTVPGSPPETLPATGGLGDAVLTAGLILVGTGALLVLTGKRTTR